MVRFCAVAGTFAAGGGWSPPPGLVQPPAAEQLLDRVLAVVGGQVILLSDVRLFLEAGLAEEPSGAADPISSALERLIERRLILDEAARYVVEDPASDEVDARLARIERRVGGSGALDAALEAAGYGRRDLEQVVVDDLRIERYLARRFPPPTRPGEAPAARRALVDDWLASLSARAAVIRVAP